jgi:predicted RNA-binding Zn-ribbon protein involved in translation (DUF1610 family)
MSRRFKPVCVTCGDTYSPARRTAGYHMCMPCGEAQSKRVRHTIVPLNKSNYICVTDRTMLSQLNPKRTT